MNNLKTFSVTSGKGGVGKTTMTVNMALALAMKGQRVLIFDGDFGMANVDLFFGVKAKNNLLDVLNGEKNVSDIIFEVQKNISVISGGHGMSDLQALNFFERRSLIDSLNEVSMSYDWILMDTSPGISDNVLYLNSAAEEICVIITPDPASFADSYALIKLMHQKYKRKKFSIICNQVRSPQEGLSLFLRFEDVVHRFLDIGLNFLGTVPQDQALRLANQESRLILRQDPKAVSSMGINQMVEDLYTRRSQTVPTGKRSMFWEQVVGVA